MDMSSSRKWYKLEQTKTYADFDVLFGFSKPSRYQLCVSTNLSTSISKEYINKRKGAL